MNISPAAAPLEARFQLNEADLRAGQNLAKQGSKALTPQRLIRVLLAVFALVLVVSILFHRTLANRAATPRESAVVGANLDNIFALLIPAGFFMIVWALLLIQGRSARAKNPMFVEPTLMTLEENALTRQCGAFFNRIEWHGIARVIASETHLITMTSPTEGFIVPCRAFANEADWRRYVDFARQQWRNAQALTPPIAAA